MKTTPNIGTWGFCLGALLFSLSAAGAEDNTQEPFSDNGATRTDEEEQQNTTGVEPSTLRAYWKEDLRFETADGEIQLGVGDNLQNDWAFTSEDAQVENAFGNLEDGTEFRRARLYLAGQIGSRVNFKAQYDFAGSNGVNFKDVWVGLRSVGGIGNIRFGHFKEPFSLEELTSNNRTTFLERSLPNAFVPSRNTGLMILNDELNGRWAAGVFRDTDSFGSGTEDGKYNLTARATALPSYREDGRRLIHIGMGYSQRKPNGDGVCFVQRPEAHLIHVQPVHKERASGGGFG